MPEEVPVTLATPVGPEPAVESKLMPPAAPATPAVEPVAPVLPICPDCKTALAVYAGDNPAKAGTGFCLTCGVRVPLGR